MSSSHWRSAPLAALLLFVAGALPAQRDTTSMPAAGGRIRVTTGPPTRRREARFHAMDSLHLLLVTAPRGDPVYGAVLRGVEVIDTVPLTRVRRLEVSETSRGRQVGGAVLGFVVGAAGGAVVVGAVGAALTYCRHCGSSGIGAMIGVPAGGILGAVVGPIIGWHRAERWRPIALPLAAGLGTPH